MGLSRSPEMLSIQLVPLRYAFGLDEYACKPLLVRACLRVYNTAYPYFYRVAACFTYCSALPLYMFMRVFTLQAFPQRVVPSLYC